MTLADPQLTRSRLGNTIRSAYSQRKAHKIVKQWPVGAPAEPPNPALVVGRGFRDGDAVGGGGQRRDNGIVSRGGGMPRQQQQLSNTGLAAVARFDSSSSCSNTGLATVACRGINAAATLVSRWWHAAAAAATAAMVSRQLPCFSSRPAGATAATAAATVTGNPYDWR